MSSVSDYLWARIELPYPTTWSGEGVFGPEHQHFQQNVFQAAYLRKYYMGDPVALRWVVPALERKLGHPVYTSQERSRLVQRLSEIETRYSITLQSKTEKVPVSQMVESYLHGIVLHINDRQRTPDFSTFPIEERRMFPAALVLWLEQAIYRVIEVATAVEFYANIHGWGVEYQTRISNHLDMVHTLLMGYLYNHADTMAWLDNDPNMMAYFMKETRTIPTEVRRMKVRQMAVREPTSQVPYKARMQGWDSEGEPDS